MRRLLPLVGSILLLLLVLYLRRNVDSFRFVVPTNSVLYATTFDGGKSSDDWSQQDRRGGSITPTDDALQLTFDPVVPNRERLRSTTKYLFEDFDYRITASATAGPLNNSYGAVFRQFDEDTYYLFYISSDGWYSVWRETPQGRIALSTWIPSDTIVQGTEGETNTLRVIGEGSTFRFFVNDTPLDVCVPASPDGESTYTNGECIDGEMQDSLTDETIPYGRLGVVIETIIDGGMAVAFDNAIVLSP